MFWGFLKVKCVTNGQNLCLKNLENELTLSPEFKEVRSSFFV